MSLAINLFFINLLLIAINSASSETRLKQLHVLFRHGERSPTDTFPNDPHSNFNWSGGWGHLTNRGKLQMYDLGEKLRAQYADFLPSFYWHEQVNVTSSYADRCLMSAELVNAGLFPPKGTQIWNYELLWQPIPVYYLPRNQDTMIAMKVKCDKYDEMYRDVLNSAKVKTVILENEDLLKYLTEHTGMQIDSIGKVETLFNTLEIEQLNNLSLPTWINQTLMEKMEELGALNLALFSETEFMKRMKGGVLLKNVVTAMEKIFAGKAPALFLYSGHDLSLVHVLRSLNLVNTIKPSFGATLVFELYSDGEVKINYRNSWDAVPVEKLIDSCTSPCQFNDWRKKLEAVLPVNWEEECQI